MANDHYVAQTYLRWFGDPDNNGRLRGYQKSKLRDFPCYPKDVCSEWDGDLNAEFLAARPELRGDFRRLCEPRWNGAVERLHKARLDGDDRYVMSAMAATLMGCTPSGRRTHVAMADALLKNFAIAAHDLEVKAGAEPSLEADAVEALRSGEITVHAEPKYTEAQATTMLPRLAQVIFEQPWLVIYNGSSAPFITSDNPFAPLCPNHKGGMTRFLPITPQLCLEIPFVREPAPPDTDLRDLKPGSVSFAEITASDARDINRLIVQCAEDLVFSPTESEGLRRLVAKYAKWGIEHDFTIEPVPGENAVMHGSFMRVRERQG
jgi:hypothetical protein